MDITQTQLLPAGPVRATITAVEAVENEFGESILLHISATAGDVTMETLRLYCTPKISPRSKLFLVLAHYGAKAAAVDAIKSEADIAKLLTGKTATLEVFENEAGHIRLRLPLREG